VVLAHDCLLDRPAFHQCLRPVNAFPPEPTAHDAGSPPIGPSSVISTRRTCLAGPGAASWRGRHEPGVARRNARRLPTRARHPMPAHDSHAQRRASVARSVGRRRARRVRGSNGSVRGVRANRRAWCVRPCLPAQVCDAARADTVWGRSRTRSTDLLARHRHHRRSDFVVSRDHHQAVLDRFLALGSERCSSWSSRSAPMSPRSNSRLRSRSALNSAPSSSTTLVIHSQTRNAMTPPSVP
jgi:hypothetical protein